MASRTLSAVSFGLLIALAASIDDSFGDFSDSFGGFSGSFESRGFGGSFGHGRGFGRGRGFGLGGGGGLYHGDKGGIIGGTGVAGGRVISSGSYGGHGGIISEVDDLSFGSGKLVHGGGYGSGHGGSHGVIVSGGHGGGYGGGFDGGHGGGFGGGHDGGFDGGHGGIHGGGYGGHNVVVGGGVVNGGRVFSGKRYGNLRRGRYGGGRLNHGLYPYEYVTGISSAHLVDAYYDVDSGYGANTGFNIASLGGPYESLNHRIVGRYGNVRPGTIVKTGKGHGYQSGGHVVVGGGNKGGVGGYHKK